MRPDERNTDADYADEVREAAQRLQEAIHRAQDHGLRVEVDVLGPHTITMGEPMRLEVLTDVVRPV